MIQNYWIRNFWKVESIHFQWKFDRKIISKFIKQTNKMNKRMKQYKVRRLIWFDRFDLPNAREISSMSASVCSHNAVMELMELTRCAKNALATSLDNSDDQRLVVIILSRGTQLAYTETNVSIAFKPIKWNIDMNIDMNYKL